jgi:hypothetical protein
MDNVEYLSHSNNHVQSSESFKAEKRKYNYIFLEFKMNFRIVWFNMTTT